MKKLPLGERPVPHIIGSAEQAKREGVARAVQERFGEMHMEDLFAGLSDDLRQELAEKEYEKSPVALRAIEIANEITNRLLEESGAQPFDVPPQNVHFLPKNLFDQLIGEEKGSRTLAVYVFARQGIFVDADYAREQDPAVLASNLFHEMKHFKEALTIEATETEAKVRQDGMVVHSSLEEDRQRGIEAKQFEGLNEGVTAQLEKDAFPEVLKRNELLAEEAAWLNSAAARKIKEEIAERESIPVDDIRTVSRDGSSWTRFPYPGQRKVLHYVVDMIAQDGKHGSRGEIFKKFVSADFVHHPSQDLKGMIEDSFGEDAFYILAGMEPDHDSHASGWAFGQLNRRRQAKQAVTQ